MVQREMTDGERMKDKHADKRADVQNSGDGGTRDGAVSGQQTETDFGQREGTALGKQDEANSGLREGTAVEVNGGAASGAEDKLARLREEMSGLRERLSAAEEEKRRLADDCRQARAERDEAVRRQEALGRESALRRYLAEKGLSGDAAEIALRGLRAGAEVVRDGGSVRDDIIIRLDSGGNLAEESRAALDGLMEGPYRPLFRIGDGESGGVRGIALDNPPLGAGIGSMSREEILSIRDGVERRRAIADNPGIFGL